MKSDTKTAKERLLQFIEREGLTKDFFSKKNFLANSTFSNKSAISTDKLLNIFKNYPQLNMDWVITGRGKMLNETEEKEGGAAKKLAPGENLSQQTLLSLAKSNETLSKANADLASNALELTLLLKANLSAATETPAGAGAIPADFLELLADVASGTRYTSKQEAAAAINSKLYGRQAAGQ